jgi:hypothetical protein
MGTSGTLENIWSSLFFFYEETEAQRTSVFNPVGNRESHVSSSGPRRISFGAYSLPSSRMLGDLTLQV